jgi:hypothetical protein
MIYEPNWLWSPKINIKLDASFGENISSHNVDASFYAIHWGFMSQFWTLLNGIMWMNILQSQYAKNIIHWEESSEFIIWHDNIIYHNLT